MIARVSTAALEGISALEVMVETGLFNQLPGIQISGLASKMVNESRDRIRAAVKQSGFTFPNKRIIVNLTPASVKKEGSHFDLPIALSILLAGGYINQSDTGPMGFIGELSLDGRILPVRGALPLVKSIRDSGKEAAVVPIENMEEASLIKDIKIKGAWDLVSLLKWLPEKEKDYEKIEKTEKGTLWNFPDFKEVKGQEEAKRAIIIGAAGGHHIFMTGYPGSGKTMLAKRIPGILPPLTLEEELEVTTIYSLAGELKDSRSPVTVRPFRSPHHTVTVAAMVGGGNIPQPGELSLSHHGVLFLDEFSEFRRDVIEVLRKPLEEGTFTVARNKTRVEFPGKILLVAASNPCPCGYYGDSRHKCKCTENEIRKYRSRLSGPILDRIDIQLEIPFLGSHIIMEETGGNSMNSQEMREKVNMIKMIQEERYKGSIRNGELTLPLIEKHCKLTKSGRAFLKEALFKLSLSMRSYHKILRLSRTISDLEGAEDIGIDHLAEAVRYRSLEKLYALKE